MDKCETVEKGLFIKNRYYPGKLLHAGDFIKEQEYGSRKLEYINHKFWGCGIIEGLEVSVGHNGRLILSAGSAIDPRGRILLVPRDMQWEPDEIENLDTEAQNAFILGIHYAEKPVETEQVILGKEINTCQVARVAETIALGAYSEEAWRRSHFMHGRETDALTQEKVLYENGDVRLTLRLPKLIPRDSIFRLRVQIQASGEKRAGVRWRGMAKLQGAVFAVSGRSQQLLEREWTGFSGTVQQEWDICTEEDRKLPVTVEFSDLEIAVEDSDSIEPETCLFYIDTVPEYRVAALQKLRGEALGDQSGELSGERRGIPDWLPLAYLRLWRNSEEERSVLKVINYPTLRVYVPRPGGEEQLRQTEEENGIVDIRWRNLLKSFQAGMRPPSPPPFPGPPGEPPFVPKPSVKPPVDSSRGVTVIPIPGRCRRGQILYSDEISHGFPGEEVLICWGVIYENSDYVYWNHSKVQYTVVQGDQKLFPGLWDTGREAGQSIGRQAIRQNVEKGTFQIALALSAGHRKNRGREVAISWTAFRMV